jgi:hypothetical protein
MYEPLLIISLRELARCDAAVHPDAVGVDAVDLQVWEEVPLLDAGVADLDEAGDCLDEQLLAAGEAVQGVPRKCSISPSTE